MKSLGQSADRRGLACYLPDGAGIEETKPWLRQERQSVGEINT
jgi:hypothetical protein